MIKTEIIGFCQKINGIRLTYILIDYPDCEYIIILNTSIVIIII
jgi:hypothetical protein